MCPIAKITSTLTSKPSVLFTNVAYTNQMVVACRNTDSETTIMDDSLYERQIDTNWNDISIMKSTVCGGAPDMSRTWNRNFKAARNIFLLETSTCPKAKRSPNWRRSRKLNGFPLTELASHPSVMAPSVVCAISGFRGGAACQHTLNLTSLRTPFPYAQSRPSPFGFPALCLVNLPRRSAELSAAPAC